MIGLGLPYAAHPDEAQLLHRAIEMLQTGNLDPGYFNYPTFPMYLHAVAAVPGIFGLVRDGTITHLGEIATMLDTGLRGQRVPVVLMEHGRQLSAVLGSLGA